MERRRLGDTDLELSEIGFGAWAIGGGDWQFGWGPQDDREAIDAIHRALELGVNWIDTAAVYGLGHSEELVGRALRERGLVAGRDVIVATKCSLVWDEQRQVGSSLQRDSVKRECEDSLRRLGVERIDLYQIHWPNDDARIEEGWRAIGELIEEGKVRWAGVSNFQREHLERAQAIRPMASLQPPYSLLRRGIEGPILEFCRAHRVGVVAYSPMQSGLLTGRFDPARLADNDWRRRADDFRAPNLAINLDLVRQLGPIAERHGKTVAQLAIAWTLRRPEVTSAIAGARRPAQIEETVGGAGWRLADEDLATIDRLLDERRARIQAAGGNLY
jgi:aryl-alcohol dehydrogenase-like predicted oxidoreductase